jgi:hypothetical protein
LIVFLANTGEVLRIVNRSGNRPLHKRDAEQLDRTIRFCRQAWFRTIYLRGVTDFTQTKHLDAWDAEDVTFLLGGLSPDLTYQVRGLSALNTWLLMRTLADRLHDPPLLMSVRTSSEGTTRHAVDPIVIPIRPTESDRWPQGVVC